jgi:tRNA dimethylallyltransferase
MNARAAAPDAVLLAGPTASGKSDWALALAARVPLEIVSVDSAQVYRGFDIGSAKPSPALRASLPHHLVDIRDPVQTYSAGEFVADALRAIRGIQSRGRLPLLVGGTMLYAKALREGLSNLPQADPDTRTQIEAEAVSQGWPALHAELARVDAVTAARLNPNDSQRIQRALEVWRVSGMPLSALQGARQPVAPSLEALSLALVPAERSVLHERIAQRFESMLAAGLVQELAGLRKRFSLDPALPSMRCVGYRQAWAYLDGELDAAGLRDQGIFATRQLAKRQLTWLRSMQGFEILDCLQPDLAGAVCERVLHWREGLKH